MKPADRCRARCPLPAQVRAALAHHKQRGGAAGILREGSAPSPPLIVVVVVVAKVRPQRSLQRSRHWAGPGAGLQGGSAPTGTAGTAPPARHGRPLAATRGHGGDMAAGTRPRRHGRGDRWGFLSPLTAGNRLHRPVWAGQKCHRCLQLPARTPARPGQVRDLSTSVSGAPTLVPLRALSLCLSL